MKKIEEIKYKVGMSENEHNLACKLNELIKAHNEKEEEYTTCEECGTQMSYGLCPCKSEEFKKYMEWRNKEDEKEEIHAKGRGAVYLPWEENVSVCNNIKCGKIIRANTTCECQKPLSHFFKPKIGENYYYICFGEVQKTDYDNGWEEDINNILTGNCYRTREEAQLALDKQQALVRLWDWADKNAPFTPEWGDFEEDKFFPVYDYEEGQLEITFEFDRKIQSLLPYFKSEEDCEKFIKEMREDLELILK